MNVKFTIKNLFNRFSNQKNGDIAIHENLGLMTLLAGESKIITDSKINGNSDGYFKIGDILIQFGKVATSDTSFTIIYPQPYDDDDVFATIQTAGNDAPTTAHIAQLDGANLPNSTHMTVIRTSGSTTEFYYWFVIGRKS